VTGTACSGSFSRERSLRLVSDPSPTSMISAFCTMICAFGAASSIWDVAMMSTLSPGRILPPTPVRASTSMAISR
jgi:hypothetical protein